MVSMCLEPGPLAQYLSQGYSQGLPWDCSYCKAQQRRICFQSHSGWLEGFSSSQPVGLRVSVPDLAVGQEAILCSLSYQPLH